jgi:predicted TIM-barrel fold metal-dependent hydrolase
MAAATSSHDSPHNAWRQVTPGHNGWARTVRSGDPNKYFIVSVDTHGIEPVDFLSSRIEKQYRDRIPRVKVDDDGAEWMITEGLQPMLVKPGRDTVKYLIERESYEEPDYFQPYTGRMEAEDRLRYRAGAELAQRARDADADGVDAEIIFPNKGMLCFTTPDPVFQQAMFRVWNRWARENFADYWDRFIPMAVIAPGDLEGAMAEVKWAAEQGFKGLTLPNKPIFGSPKPGELQYNDKHFDPLWSLIAEVDLPMTFHVSTGRDPRGVTGLGGAVINYVCHSMPTVMEPLVNLISSGVFERHPKLQAGSIEGGIGWVPWMLEAMDYSFQAHHMWVRPVMPELPSFYYRRNCFSAFMEDHVTLPRAEELNIADNLMWSNDYPHHEGSWPHSAESIERQLGCVTEANRAKILGLNAARVFKLKVPTGKQ